MFAVIPYAATQTLARPGWAGSGLNAEPWWRSAVFYRVAPERFQDSDGDGIGDLPGLTSRLDYLQTLGVDAILIEPVPARAGKELTTDSGHSVAAPPAPAPLAAMDQPGFDDLLPEASRRHLRVIVVLPLTGDPATLTARARLAFTRGAAGIDLERPEGNAPVPSTLAAAAILPSLRSLAAGFPGERVVLSELSLPAAPAPSFTAHRTEPSRGRDAGLREALAPELVLLPASAAPSADAATRAASLRTLLGVMEALPSGTAPLLAQGHLPAPTGPPESRPAQFPLELLAVRLLTLRSAVSLQAGQELGLPATWDNLAATAPGASGVPANVKSGIAAGLNPAEGPLLQWTPSNITPPAVKIEPNTEANTPAPRSDVYGAYHPYVPVKPKPLVLPGMAAPPPDPNTLPGFTSGRLPLAPAAILSVAKRNVAVEDSDPRSLLNLYRRLVALHHGHATLRTGSTAVLDLGTDRALAWVRRAPAGARTVASVVVACNLSDAPLTLALDTELDRAHVRAGLLRPLLGQAAATNGPQSTSQLSLAPYSVYVGEIYHH